MKTVSYAVIADAIDTLVAQASAPPPLEALAARAGYDHTHFQKLFTAYVGLSPKQLSHYLQARRARPFLVAGGNTLNAAEAAGISGNARLHDLFLKIEAATPGEVKKRGAGLRIVYGVQPTPLGRVMIAKTPRGICWLGFMVDGSPAPSRARLRAHWPLAELKHDDEAVAAEAAQITVIWGRHQRVGTGTKKPQRLRLDLYGTNFQIRVWEALLSIPIGATTTYAEISRQVGRPKAARAIGNAVGANPVSLLIPCHRVIRATGIIDNYRWGSARKKLILGVEEIK